MATHQHTHSILRIYAAWLRLDGNHLPAVLESAELFRKMERYDSGIVYIADSNTVDAAGTESARYGMRTPPMLTKSLSFSGTSAPSIAV